MIAEGVGDSTYFLRPLPVKVVGIHRESKDAVSLTIEAPRDYPAWRAGQFNMLYVFGLGEIAVSISGDHDNPKRMIHTVKGVGPVTHAITRWQHIRDTEGLLYMRGPFGSCWPDITADQDLMLIGGGIGLAPLRPVIQSYLSQTMRRRLLVLYGMKHPAEALYRNEWSVWHEGWDVHFVLSADRPAPGWEGEVGHVTELISRLNIDAGKTIAMICGPEIMMRSATDELRQQGVSPDQIFVSMERHMKCAVALCGRCQWGPHFVCRDGPIFRLSDVLPLWQLAEF
jgi:NAD(P)H-flavin reductase